MGVNGTASWLGEVVVQTFSTAPLAAVFISSGLVEHNKHSGPPRSCVAGLKALCLAALLAPLIPLQPTFRLFPDRVSKMFPASAGFPDLASSAAAAKATSQKDKRQAAMQPIRALLTDIAKGQGGAPAEGGSAPSSSSGSAAPA
eukprot:3545733-Alexandrium_andersonii.AAC.1